MTEQPSTFTLDSILKCAQESSNINKRLVFADIVDERVLTVMNILCEQNEKPVLIWKKGDYEMYSEIIY